MGRVKIWNQECPIHWDMFASQRRKELNGLKVYSGDYRLDRLSSGNTMS